MREFQEKRKLRGLLYSKKTITLLIVILALLSYSTIKLYLKSRTAVSKSEGTEKELTDLEKRESDLEQNVKNLQSESGLEAEIREKFNVEKPGEKTLVIVDKNAENGKINSGEEAGGFFSGIWQWIKEKF